MTRTVPRLATVEPVPWLMPVCEPTPDCPKPVLPVRSPVPELNPLLPNPLLPNPDRKSTRLNSSHLVISYAVFCLKKKKQIDHTNDADDALMMNEHIVVRRLYTGQKRSGSVHTDMLMPLVLKLTAGERHTRAYKHE